MDRNHEEKYKPIEDTRSLSNMFKKKIQNQPQEVNPGLRLKFDYDNSTMDKPYQNRWTDSICESLMLNYPNSIRDRGASLT